MPSKFKFKAIAHHLRFLYISHLLRGPLKKPPVNEITEPLAFTVHNTGALRESSSVTIVFCAHVLAQWLTKMGKTEGKQCATNQKETEEQLLKCDYKEALLTI